MNENNITKKCRVCQVEKTIGDFYPDKASKDKHRSDCKICNCESRKKWQRENLPKVLIKNELWRQKNKEHVREWKNNYAPRRRSLVRDKYKNNQEFKEKRIKSSRAYRSNPKNKKIIRNTQSRLRKKYAKNPMWRVIMNLRRRLNHVLQGNRKSEATKKLIGCDLNTLKNHLQLQFKNGMSWDNYGKWHIDHIKPCALFDMSLEEEQRKCFHYTNLQPLWAIDNLIKGDNYL
jgi:hypothetical protein